MGKLSSQLNRLVHLLKSLIASGNKPQTFIGAKWIITLLRVAPQSKKRDLALKLLALSPHYFIRDADSNYAKLPFRQFLEAEYTRNRISRQKIYHYILKDHLSKSDLVLDYGCGPGFLAKEVANFVRRVYACDISQGVLECAKVINAADNIEYIHADTTRLNAVSDGSLDVVYSFAVIQHVTDQVLDEILESCTRKLKPGGKLVFQVQLEDPQWRSEAEWRADTSWEGRLRYRYALHSFGRTSDFFQGAISKHGFRNIEISSIADTVDHHFDDVCHQHL